MTKIKYIVTKGNDIIIFNEFLSHDDFKTYEPISAGFVSFTYNVNTGVEGRCYGQSVSLGLKSNEERDTMLLNMKLFGL